MPIIKETKAVDNIFLGNDEVEKVLLGNAQMWPEIAPVGGFGMTGYTVIEEASPAPAGMPAIASFNLDPARRIFFPNTSPIVEYAINDLTDFSACTLNQTATPPITGHTAALVHVMSGYESILTAQQYASNASVRQLSLTVPGDLTATKSFNKFSPDLRNEADTNYIAVRLNKLAFSPDGLMLFGTANSNSAGMNAWLYQWGLSVPFDISTVDTVAAQRTPQTGVGGGKSFTFSDDGLEVMGFFTGNTNRDLTILRMDSPYDLSSAVVSQSFPNFRNTATVNGLMGVFQDERIIWSIDSSAKTCKIVSY